MTKLALNLLLALFAGSAVQAAEPPGTSDFAYAMPLQIESGMALHQIPLPREAYLGAAHADLRDLAVFNGAGEIVPFALRHSAAERSGADTAIALPLFPIHAQSQRSLAGLSLRVRRDGSGAILDVDASDETTTERRLVAYLLDASSLTRPIKALTPLWETGDEGFVVTLRVEASDDLERWETLTGSATIANLEYGGHHLSRREIALPPTRARYLRLSLPEDQAPLHLTGVQAQLETDIAEPAREWLRIPAATDKEHPQEYFFDLQGRMPVDRVRITLPQKNTLVRATLHSRAHQDAAWQPRAEALVYDLRVEGSDLVNPDIPVAASGDRHWRLRIAPQGGLGRGLPALEAGWVPQQLLFVARGDGPFLLAYGSARADARKYRAHDLLDGFGQRSGVAFKTAQLGPQMTLSGTATLTPPAPPLPWRQWLLWCVLVLGVALLGWMALRLYRQMNR